MQGCGCFPRELGEGPRGAETCADEQQHIEAVHQLVSWQLRVVQYVAWVCCSFIALLAAIGLQERTECGSIRHIVGLEPSSWHGAPKILISP